MSGCSKEKMSISSKKKWRRGSLEPNVEQIDSETDYNKFTQRCDSNLCSFVLTADGHFVPLEPKIQQISGCAYYDAQYKLKYLVCKSASLFLTLNQVVVDFPHLFSLILDYCNLTSDHINLLEDTLKMTKTVKLLSLVGNPGRNFYRLIGCGLKVLSLKLCNIDHQELKQIALEYANLGVRREAATLIHLDLSLNPVFDEGCHHLAAILRCDRTLRSLNLTDCKITDKGVEMLASSFLPFTLNREELAVRRRIRFDYYRLQQKLSDGSCDSLPPDDASNSLKAKLSATEIWLNQHPFTNQDSMQQDGEVICKGNYSLETLNLSYNHLSKPSLELLLKVLTGQTERGLKRLVLESCALKDQTLKNTIQDYLTLGKATARLNLKKRRSSASNSVSEKSSVAA